MFSGPPLPLPATLSLHELFIQAKGPGPLGAWMRGCRRTFHLYETGDGQGSRIIIGSDLGYLLARCSRVALREGRNLVVLEAETVIRWRTLQVVTSNPYLPGLEQLGALFDGLRSSSAGLEIPVGPTSPEEVLAELLARGVQILGSSIQYSPSAYRSEQSG